MLSRRSFVAALGALVVGAKHALSESPSLVSPSLRVRTGLPTVAWRRLNERTKAERAPMRYLRSVYERDEQGNTLVWSETSDGPRGPWFKVALHRMKA
jgi:hypothetical protein